MEHEASEVNHLAAEAEAEAATLRRVAGLVASGAPAEALLAEISQQLARGIHLQSGAPYFEMTGALRFEPDATATIVAQWSEREDDLPLGSNWPLEGDDAPTRVYRTGRPARMDDSGSATGALVAWARAHGATSGTTVPIVIEGRLWGCLYAITTRAEGLPADAEERITDFAELVTVAIAGAHASHEARRLAEEQAALRRVATLVSRQPSPDEVFAAVAEELGVLLGVDASAILRYEPDCSATAVAGWSDRIEIPVGRRFPLEGDNLAGRVLATGQAQRLEDYSAAQGPIAAIVRELGIRSAVACPMIVDGRIWGVIAVLSLQPEPLPPDTESRIAEFSRHGATAIANTNTRAELAASRARIIATGDATRRRFERDLHDGVQQRLVSLMLELRGAEDAVPEEHSDLRARLLGVQTGLSEALESLRELSQGLHPAILTEGGLRPALRALARRSALPTKLAVDVDERLDEHVEVAAYYVVSEALTNAAKHARASRVDIKVEARERTLELTVRDDGVGGADPGSGTGLIGLADRIEALGGRIAISSPVGAGTSIRVNLPVVVAES